MKKSPAPEKAQHKKEPRRGSAAVQRFGKQVAAARDALGISQAELARRATKRAKRPIARLTIARIETGVHGVGLDTLLAIAGALDTTASDLLRGIR